MRPKNLKFPFAWEERKPVFSQGVLFVPKYYFDHGLWSMPQDLFCADVICIEYCSGNGDWIIDKAKQDLDKQWIAVEKRFDRIQKIWSKLINHKIENLLIVCGDAMTFSENYVPKEKIDEVYVNFPDPWPKVKHAKNRLIQQNFISQLFRITKPHATITFATDDSTYSNQMISEMNQSCLWEPCLEFPHYTNDWKDYGSSWFETLWKDKGRVIYYMQFTKSRV